MMVYGSSEPRSERRYVLQVAARLVGVHPRTIRYYEELGLLARREDRRYSEADLERLRLIRRLVDDLGVNLAGAEVILNMRERMIAMLAEAESLRREYAVREGQRQ